MRCSTGQAKKRCGCQNVRTVENITMYNYVRVAPASSIRYTTYSCICKNADAVAMMTSGNGAQSVGVFTSEDCWSYLDPLYLKSLSVSRPCGIREVCLCTDRWETFHQTVHSYVCIAWESFLSFKVPMMRMLNYHTPPSR